MHAKMISNHRLSTVTKRVMIIHATEVTTMLEKRHVLASTLNLLNTARLEIHKTSTYTTQASKIPISHYTI